MNRQTQHNLKERYILGCKYGDIDSGVIVFDWTWKVVFGLLFENLFAFLFELKSELIAMGFYFSFFH